ncbi:MULTISPECIES: lactate utilization protein B [unclassified Imperialibacter]|uniref:lactate utilization protein B n=1 Tax=unclassified Imperialibacter TaxID=2629706 RepID=UPI001256937D|nr:MULTISPECIES: lactate utilization protein B [unclassified Imperialibacter]CAD5252122.1 Lactate utilization protein B [Imperialibacter sp. 75]CAD5298206.1 Lactate utilization protein B [Imperialibacter sp. 89]VVT13462.1 Lactate utilization protein B [Imperialibacter sp. EC-SDR9]
MSHSTNTVTFLKDNKKVDWHNETLWWVRSKRDVSSKQIPEWEQLRELASGIKDSVLSNLAGYLEEFEKNAIANGINVHWAADAKEHNEIVTSILQKHNAQKLVKSKSILTEECHLNEHLEAHGFEVVDTDLGERIIQFVRQPPSHIVMPAIHLKKEDISEIFHEHLQTEKGNNDPQYLTEAARQHLRNKFIEADIALTGVNFGIAETGGFVVCTNEGNADMGVHLAPVHIACMGIEKLIPKLEHLGVYTRLLARSATGQPITNYTSHFHRPRSGQEMHIILVDNGRTEQLSREKFRNSLKCIRCGACMNTCPIYRRSGGYSYDATVPGPIGSILSPGVDLKKHQSLPFASTLCGSCSDVCPVKINIHEQLYEWRQVVADEKLDGAGKRISMTLAAKVLASPSLYNMLGKLARKSLSLLPKSLINNPLNAWGKQRDLPAPPKASFKEWYAKNRKS